MPTFVDRGESRGQRGGSYGTSRMAVDSSPDEGTDFFQLS
jgi:hypothetical protein